MRTAVISTPASPVALRRPSTGNAPLTVASARHTRARHVVTPALAVADTAAAAVFAAARGRGPVARDTIARRTGLSIATVNRQVTALLEAGLLRERADLSASGAVGRPRIPVEVDHEPFLTLGIHIGAATTSITATDLLGRTLDAVETPTPRAGQDAALAALAASARRYLARWHRRRPLWVGVAAGGVVDGHSGLLDHPRLGWSQAPVGPALADALGLPVSVATHVAAMAGAELLLGASGRAPAPGSTSLYLYARETVGFALSLDGRVHSPVGGPGTITALPTHSEMLGGTGQLESTVSDEAVLAAARRAGVIPAGGSTPAVAAVVRAARHGDVRAQALLEERARVLGETAALLRDILNPDDLVLGGQAFTGYPEAMPALTAAFAARSVLPPRDLRLTSFGNRVQEAGAGVVSLAALYADPIGAMRRALRP